MHRFTDRRAGDLAVGQPTDVVEARRRAVLDAPWTWLHQVHGAAVVTVTRPGEHAGAVADAAVTATPGCPVAVQVADCAPVLFEADGAAGVAHVGWRGLVAGVVEATVDALERLGHPPSGAVIGPCIGAHHYEFGADDLDLVAARYGDGVRATTADGHPALDLAAGITAACGARGIPVRQVGPCTACSDRFWSHRARGDEERQALVAWVTP